MSHWRHETDGHTSPWHNIGGVSHAVRYPPSHPHHCQSVQEYYIDGLTLQLPDCTCGVPLQFVLKLISVSQMRVVVRDEILYVE